MNLRIAISEARWADVFAVDGFKLFAACDRSHPQKIALFLELVSLCR
ncbi:hypothetical protein IQ247_05300 [Plectonema cf. radiosum LEGE 06105]|uniref:Uncharacterized protein n=1 Tax=Plectonema cf. radiosum LEGE 06105 TaxID=945769 RepID=A0A8J7F1R9_9CYAN|nr:hypothetical protein [Plectonema radiosum]MBE9212133.1 hypothetical protein [Plectonema cf. radiosum LEGE 06105]